MRLTQKSLWSLVILIVIALPALAMGAGDEATPPAEPETVSSVAEILWLLEPPVSTSCFTSMCIQIEVFAHNPQTGECRSFPNPCSVPPGWILGCP